jgi:hypothetical protein
MNVKFEHLIFNIKVYFMLPIILLFLSLTIKFQNETIIKSIRVCWTIFEMIFESTKETGKDIHKFQILLKSRDEITFWKY